MPKCYFNAPTIDDAMRMVFEEILGNGVEVRATKGGNLEITGIVIEISNPRARLSMTETRGIPFSCLGELCWYLSGTDSEDFISYYIKHYIGSGENGAISGAYGPRLMNWKGISQISNVEEILRRKPHSRRAVIQLFDATDLLAEVEDVPCTCTMQFFVRSGTLHMIVHMRSNDAYLGLPHDFFCFTMIQEILSRALNLEVGSYKHMVGSLHLYEKHYKAARGFIKEGWQSLEGMPPMPLEAPWTSIRMLLEAEERLRIGTGQIGDILSDIDPYWADLVRMLVAFRCKKQRDIEGIRTIRGQISCNLYYPFLDRLTH